MKPRAPSLDLLMLTASIRHRRRLEYLFSSPGKSWWEFGAVRLRSKKRSCQQSSGNVFADLGLRDAGEKQTRVRLAVAIQELKKFIKLIVSLLEAFRSGSSRFSR